MVYNPGQAWPSWDWCTTKVGLPGACRRKLGEAIGKLASSVVASRTLAVSKTAGAHGSGYTRQETLLCRGRACAKAGPDTHFVCPGSSCSDTGRTCGTQPSQAASGGFTGRHTGCRVSLREPHIQCSAAPLQISVFKNCYTVWLPVHLDMALTCTSGPVPPFIQYRTSHILHEARWFPEAPHMLWSYTPLWAQTFICQLILRRPNHWPKLMCTSIG